MDRILSLIEENYLLVTIVACFLILSLIGYLSDILKNKDIKLKVKENNKTVLNTSDENDSEDSEEGLKM